MTLNLSPLITLLKKRIQAWKNLSLFLIGKINFIRMKILLVILYFLCHDPIWVPKSYFKKLDEHISLCLHLGLKVLQEPWGQGGLALPYRHKYYLAGQMVFARCWLLGDNGDSATVLKAAILGSNESLQLALFRGRKSVLSLTRSMKATIRAWATSQQLMQPDFKGISPSAPLWMNPCLPHFYELPDPWGVGNKGNQKSGWYCTWGEPTHLWPFES